MAFIPPLIAAAGTMLSAAAPALIGGAAGLGAGLLASRSGSSGPTMVQSSSAPAAAARQPNASIGTDSLAVSDRRRGGLVGGGETGVDIGPLGARGGGRTPRTTLLGS